MTSYETDIGTATIRAMQFENANEGRSYPFADNAVLRASSGDVLPDGVVSDAHIVIPKGTSAYLSSVYVSDHLVSVCIGVMSSGHRVGALSVTVARSDLESYRPYRLEKLAGSEDMGGIVSFGQLPDDMAKGAYRFSPGEVVFSDAAVAEFKPASLRRIVDDRSGASVSGDVSIRFANHVDASKVLLPSGSEGVYLSLRDGSASALASSCDRKKPENACGTTPVKSINGIKPDANGRIVLWFH